MIDHVRAHILSLPRPANENYSIDEQVIPYEGRLPLGTKLTIKNKPRPTGLRNNMLATETGLVLDFQVYQGITTDLPADVPGIGPSVVVKLTETLPLGSHMFIDRFFTTVDLLRHLAEKQIQATGTIMTNRIGSSPISERLQKGESEQFVDETGKVALVRWKDSRDVLVVSNSMGTEPESAVRRWDKKSGEFVKVKCPAVIKVYNHSMGGIDIFDQMMEYYRAFYRTHKYTVKVITHFVEFACTNAYQEQRHFNKDEEYKVTGLFKFRYTVARSLMKVFSAPNIARKEETLNLRVVRQYSTHSMQPTADLRYDGYNHFPFLDQALKNSQRCRYEGCKKKSKFRCRKCNVFICVGPSDCFFLYHNKTLYNED